MMASRRLRLRLMSLAKSDSSSWRILVLSATMEEERNVRWLGSPVAGEGGGRGVGADVSIVVLPLPDFARAPELTIDSAAAVTFQRVQMCSPCRAQRVGDEVDVVRHHDRGVEDQPLLGVEPTQ